MILFTASSEEQFKAHTNDDEALADSWNFTGDFPATKDNTSSENDSTPRNARAGFVDVALTLLATNHVDLLKVRVNVGRA